MHLSGSKIGITFDQLHETNWNFQGQPGRRWEKVCGGLTDLAERLRSIKEENDDDWPPAKMPKLQ